MNRGLWATNGEPSGHVVIKSPLRLYSGTSVVVRDRLLFSAFDATRGYELWSSDGTAQGTGLVFDVWPGPESSSPSAFAAVGDRVAFEALYTVRRSRAVGAWQKGGKLSLLRHFLPWSS